MDRVKLGRSVNTLIWHPLRTSLSSFSGILCSGPLKKYIYGSIGNYLGRSFWVSFSVITKNSLEHPLEGNNGQDKTRHKYE